jgi:PPM family protein phosphatase
VTRFDQIEHACLSDVGVRRPHNQDNHAVQLAADEDQWRQRGHLFLVADGMGAHAVGEKASEQATRVIPHTYHKYAQQGPVPALRKAFIEANASIHACGQQNREFEGMGTTSTALLLRPEGAWVGHVGDSRVYRIRDGAIEQLSFDHSLVWEYARLKQVDPDDVQDIPSNVIHRCLGPEPLVQVDIEGPHPVRGGDLFLLCSDGLSGPVSDHEIGAIAAALPPAEACRLLVDLANLRGGPDNITVLIVRIPGSADGNGVAPPAPPPPPWQRVPWWAWTLFLGTLLVAVATNLGAHEIAGAVFFFLLGAVAILAGLVGLGLAYQREKTRQAAEAEELPQPRVHRKASCRIEQPLLDKLARQVQALRQHADEKHWEPDWPQFDAHYTLAGELLQKKDLPAAFREYCRAMLPLTRALQKQRHKEEVFQPVWDKTF